MTFSVNAHDRHLDPPDTMDECEHDRECIHCNAVIVKEQNPNGFGFWREKDGGNWGCLVRAEDEWYGEGEPPAPYPPHELAPPSCKCYWDASDWAEYDADMRAERRGF